MGARSRVVAPAKNLSSSSALSGDGLSAVMQTRNCKDDLPAHAYAASWRTVLTMCTVGHEMRGMAFYMLINDAQQLLVFSE
jgi:hypothetical protein